VVSLLSSTIHEYFERDITARSRSSGQVTPGWSNLMSDQKQPLKFYFNGLIALALLFLLTLTMAPAPEVNYLRAMIAVGVGIVVLKMFIRRYRPHWLSDPHRGSRRR
jgi:hypothetical protein